MNEIGGYGMRKKNLKKKKFLVAIKSLWMYSGNCCSLDLGVQIELFPKPGDI